MPLGDGSRRVTGWVTCVGIAAATVVARLPFLLRADRFFNSDEAVEGLMARHVSLHEHPLFMWGQRFKGVPEVYLTSAVLRGFSPPVPGVIALKAVTLACFAVFVCLNFTLLTRTCSRRVAWIATMLLLACPPTLVLWSLSGSAEIVMTFLAGAIMCLGVDAWRRSGSQRGLVVASAALGFGLWVQQYMLYYVIALALTILVETPDWREQLQGAMARRPAWNRWAVQILLVLAVVCTALGFVAFFGGGFQARPFGLSVVATSPQRMWWIATEWLLAAIVTAMLGRVRPVHLGLGLAFLAGYWPAIVGRLSASGRVAPMGSMDVTAWRSSISVMLRYMVPMLAGFRSPTTGRLDVPAWSALLIVAVLVISFIHVWRRSCTPFFHIVLLAIPVLFVASGSFIDAQSDRYLMPLFAAFPAVCAIGIDSVLRVNRMAGIALLSGLLALFVLEQADWYRGLEPDRESATIVACLDRAGVTAASANYWVSYKVTFLTDERIILAPTSGVDRYPTYTATVRASSRAVTVVAPAPDAAEPVSCRLIVQEADPAALSRHY